MKKKLFELWIFFFYIKFFVIFFKVLLMCVIFIGLSCGVVMLNIFK